MEWGSTKNLPRFSGYSCRSVIAGLALVKLKLPCSHIRVTALRMNMRVQMVSSKHRTSV